MQHYTRIILWFLLLSPIVVIAENPIDSLLISLSNEKLGEEKVLLLDDLAWEYQGINIDSALFYAKEGLALAQKIENDTLVQALYNTRGVIEMYLGDYKAANETLLKARQIAVTLGREEQVNDADTNLAIIYAQQAKMDTAILYFTRVKNFWNKKYRQDKLEETYINIGMCNSIRGFYINAIENYFEALKMAEGIGNTRGMARTYNNIATCYWRIEEPQQAIEYSKKGLDIAFPNNDLRTASKCYSTIGLSLMSLEKYEEALNYFKKELPLKYKLKDKYSIAKTYSNISESLQNLMEYDSAMVYANKALVIQKELDNKQGMAITYSNIGTYLLQKQELNKAYENFILAEKFAEESNTKTEISNSYKNLSLFFKQNKDFEKAYLYLAKHKVIKDSLFNEKKINRLAEIRELYSLAKDSIKQVRYELNLANKDKTIAKRTSLLIAFAAMSVIVLLIAFFQFYKKRKERIEKELLQAKNQLLKEKRQELENNNEKLIIKIDEASQALKTPQFFAQQKITLSNREKSTFLLGEIICIKSTGGALVFTRLNKDIKRKQEIWDWSKSLKAIQQELPSSLFLQVHRSCIVNVLKIQSLKKDILVLSNNTELKVGRSYIVTVKAYLNNNAVRGVNPAV